MKIETTPLEGLIVIQPDVFHDSRGYFSESFNYERLTNFNIKSDFVQDNESFSNRGVLRGLHYQNYPKSQTKLVRVVRGKILDVVVDVRSGEPTFGKHFSIELSEENKKQLYIPRGFAHGFVVLSEGGAIVHYKADSYYEPKLEKGIRFDDPTLNINWILSPEELIVSEKDMNLPTL